MDANLKTKNEALSKLMEEHVALKKPWAKPKDIWVSQDIRDAVIDFVKRWSSA